MWFIFAQMRDLSRSAMAELLALSSLEKAERYLAYPGLSLRLTECTRAVRETEAPFLHDIFGSPNDLKFCPSMELRDQSHGVVGGR